jgi:hypothetical protein
MEVIELVRDTWRADDTPKLKCTTRETEQKKSMLRTWRMWHQRLMEDTGELDLRILPDTGDKKMRASRARKIQDGLAKDSLSIALS